MTKGMCVSFTEGEEVHKSGWVSCSSAGVKGWSQPAVHRRGRECVGLRALITFLPSPEETAASGTSPENSDGATSPQTP